MDRSIQRVSVQLRSHNLIGRDAVQAGLGTVASEVPRHVEQRVAAAAAGRRVREGERAAAAAGSVRHGHELADHAERPVEAGDGVLERVRRAQVE